MKTQDSYSVFLVDDDKMFLSSLKNALNSEFKKGLEVSTFTSGEDCLKNINGKPDIIVLDYLLNDDQHPQAMDGMKVLQEIKKVDYRDILVIMLSGQDKLQVAIDSIKNGAYEYVAKSESAFVRIRNIIRNAVEGIKSDRVNKSYLKWNIVLGATIVVIVLIDILYYYLGHF
ncbi:MAG TPA: response regulator [Bacteroidia bacterium]|jgi:two-component system OmpR family response regulator|nr:response regulator [Bacteroidia bacterium]